MSVDTIKNFFSSQYNLIIFEAQGSELTDRCLIHYTMKDLQNEWLKTKICSSVSKLLRPSRKLTAISEQNCEFMIPSSCSLILLKCCFK